MTKGKHAPNLIRRGPFLAMWSISYACLWTVLILYTATTLINVEWVGEVGILAITGVFALLQQRLLQRPVVGWVVSTLVGTLIALGLFNSLINTGSPTMLLLSLILLVPTSLVQMAWLSRLVKSAWLWPLANVAAAMSFAFLFRETNMSELGLGVIGIGLAQGFIQAVVMRHLWTGSKDIEEAHKVIAMPNKVYDEQRLARLQEHSQSSSLWTPDAEQVAHQSQ